MKFRRLAVCISLVAASIGLTLGTQLPASATTTQPTKVAVIVFENQNRGEVDNNATDWPYLTNTARPTADNFSAMHEQFITCTDDDSNGACDSSTSGEADSAPEYAVMTAGSCDQSSPMASINPVCGITDIWADSTAAYNSNVTSVFSVMGSGGRSYTWKSLNENYVGSDCTLGLSDASNPEGYKKPTSYARKHNPAAFYSDVSTACSGGNTADLPHFTDSGPHGPSDVGYNNQFITQNFTGSGDGLSSNLDFIIPDLCHETHNGGICRQAGQTPNLPQEPWTTTSACGTYGSGVVLTTKQAAADYWLCLNLPKIRDDVGSTGVVLLTWDEGDENCNGSGCGGAGDTQQVIPTYLWPGTGGVLDDCHSAPCTNATTYDQTSIFKALLTAFGGGLGSNCTTLFSDAVQRASCNSGDAALPLALYTTTGGTPVITNVNPLYGQSGDSIDIQGSSFTGATAVTLAGISASSFHVNTDTDISATVPAGDASGVVQVTANSNTGSGSQTFYVDNTHATVPGTPSFSNIDANEVTVSWTGSTDTGGSGVDHYRVFRCSGASCTPTVKDVDVTAPTTSFDDTGLSNSTTYGYAIRSTDRANNNSGKSATAYVTTSGSSCPSISSIGSGALGSSITISGCGFLGDGIYGPEVGFQDLAFGGSYLSVNPTSYSDTSITVKVPYGTTGGKTVRVYLSGNTHVDSAATFTPTGAYAKQATTAGGNSQTANAGSWPASTTAGDLLVIAVNRAGSTVSTPSGWTKAKDEDSSASIFYKVAAGGDSSPNFTVGGGSSIDWSALAVEFAGAPTTLDKTAGYTSGTSNVTIAKTTNTADTTAASELIFGTAQTSNAYCQGGGAETVTGSGTSGATGAGDNDFGYYYWMNDGDGSHGEFFAWGTQTATGGEGLKWQNMSCGSFHSRGAMATWK